MILNSSFQALWDWVILVLVIYTAVFTPYVAAFLLNETPEPKTAEEEAGTEPIVIIDLLGKSLIFFKFFFAFGFTEKFLQKAKAKHI
jgi:hypothetical protein